MRSNVNAKSDANAAQVLPSPESIPIELLRKLEKLSSGAAPKLALLIRWSEAESSYDPGGSNPQLDKLAWRGIEDVLRDVLRDVEELQRLSGVFDGPFACWPE